MSSGMAALTRYADALPPGDREMFLSDLRRITFWEPVKLNAERDILRRVRERVRR